MIGWLALIPLVATHPGPTAFADALMRQGDYFRAITEYKRTLFESDDPELRRRCTLRIGRAYRKSMKRCTTQE